MYPDFNLNNVQEGQQRTLLSDSGGKSRTEGEETVYGFATCGRSYLSMHRAEIT